MEIKNPSPVTLKSIQYFLAGTWILDFGLRVAGAWENRGIRSCARNLRHR